MKICQQKLPEGKSSIHAHPSLLHLIAKYFNRNSESRAHDPSIQIRLAQQKLSFPLSSNSPNFKLHKKTHTESPNAFLFTKYTSLSVVTEINEK
mmetsp:Transcript_10009/g.37355  ORF Transcript_10009/g.37355 Transcript_10009/m.37355 type:complete len:94 (-) Transcript_10009:291-572(-)